MHAVLNVRRFTALDMHGTTGSRRRRTLILGEFVLGCLAIVLLGVVLLHAGDVVLGAYALGVGLNYLPLAMHGLSLSRHRRLETELADVHDLHSQLIRAGAAQLLLLVPLLVALAAAHQRMTRGPRRSQPHE